jgi:UDP:flavonoid glycosyltransferase YjiC (YdhE family)
MKALLFSLGTRGDIEPFLAFAQHIKKSGHTVICAFPVQFQDFVQDLGFDFRGLSEKFLELLEGEKAKLILGGQGNIFKKMNALIWMIRVSQSMQKEVMIQQHDIVDEEKPDIIIYNQKCLYPMVWGMGNPGKTTLLSPLPCTIHEFTSHAALGMGGDHGKFLNRLTYRFSNFFLFQTIKSATKKYHKELGLKLRVGQIKEYLLRTERMIYTISPSLFERPVYWPQNVQIVGHYERYREDGWRLEKDLEKFIDQQNNIVFITFGSMTNPEPAQKTSEILSVLAKLHIPAIINTASGGLVRPESYPDHVYFTENIPYSHIFPKVYAVIHHGGSGTTHTAVKHGCANMIIPHILDQHVWNDIIFQQGLGPKGFPVKKLTAKRLEEKLHQLLDNPAYKDRAMELAGKMQKETHNRIDLLKLLGLTNK